MTDPKLTASQLLERVPQLVIGLRDHKLPKVAEFVQALADELSALQLEVVRLAYKQRGLPFSE